VEEVSIMLTIVSSWRRFARCLPSSTVAAMLALGVVSVPPALAQQAPTVTVVLTELQFNPKTITLTAGQPVQNAGKADHNLSSRDSADAIPISNVTYQKADNDPRQLRSYEADSILDTDVNSGHTSVVTFTPTRVGTFKFVSNAGDDEMNAMVGSFVVVAAGAQATTAPAQAPATSAAPPSPAGSSVARDGQSLTGQPAATQAMFIAVWGASAAQQWAEEHNAAVPR
jgi:plastocyanin